MTIEFATQIENLRHLVLNQFYSRTTVEGRRNGKDFRGATMDVSIYNMEMWITISTVDEAHVITVPMPFVENGVELIKSNEVKRAICKHFDVKRDVEISYLEVIERIFAGDPTGLINTVKVKKSSFMQQLAYSILNQNTTIVVYNLQKAISEVVNKMPLHETYMNSYIMNQRLMMIDPDFEGMSSPQDRLDYQTEKNRTYFGRGWTSIGLSDGTLADKNYILKRDLRGLTVFGEHHHNPQRNLFSTLGMKGDEMPRLRSASAQELINAGITRKGWNMFTLFADVPETFEDQVLVDISHANKAITSERRFQCFGEMLVKVGDKLKLHQPMVKCPDGEITTFKVKAERAWVDRIVKSSTLVGGVKTDVFNVIVKYKRYLKDATKFTNTHGNKGVIRLFDLGYAIDPATGEQRKIDVIVSAKSVKKRKNHGQIIEALTNAIYEKTGVTKVLPDTDTKSTWLRRGVAVSSVFKTRRTALKPLVFADNHYYEEGLDMLKADLRGCGLPEDGVWDCKTMFGDITGVCGTVFWGVIKEPEDQLWDEGVTERVNGKDLRVAGLKFSTVEFKALETSLGPDNAVLREVLGYTQGTDVVTEGLKVLRSQFGMFPENLPLLSMDQVKMVDQSNGTMFTKEALIGTVADDGFYEDGFLLQLPVIFQTVVGLKAEDSYEGAPVFDLNGLDPLIHKAGYVTDKIYVPTGYMRKNWRHSTGMFGMSELSVLVNNIVTFAKRYAAEPQEMHHINLLYSAISTYFNRMSFTLGTKRGDVANYAMSVRYPFSAKAVASLSTTLPAYHVQIHEKMAEILNVTSGDVVLTERFPCLGFMGVRVVKVLVTDDPLCRYTIRVSGNGLVSQNLDFDGDVIYLASFHTPEAKELLNKEWETPNPACWRHTHQLNIRKGEPSINCLSLDDYEIAPFPTMTQEEQAKIVRKLTGVKAQTGPVIAMAYNLMRIMESAEASLNLTPEQRADIEMFIEKTGQSVFEQKHGGTSLCEIVLEAVCTGNVGALIAEGYDPDTTNLICGVVRDKAAKYGIHDLVGYHEKVGKNGSNIINKIVKIENKIYFASRSALGAHGLLECLSAPVVDLPSRIFALTMSGTFNNQRTYLVEHKENKLLEVIRDEDLRGAGKELFGLIDKLFTGKQNNQSTTS